MSFIKFLYNGLRDLGSILSKKIFWINFFPNIFHYSRFKNYPIIICGCPRSGTTLLMAILDSHREIHVIPFETMVFQKIKGRYSKRLVVNQFISKIHFLLVIFSSKIKPQSSRWAEKTPLNILNVDEINSFFSGKVKFINVIRDGRAVTSSNHQTLGQFVGPDLWKRCIYNGLLHDNKNYFKTIRYEDLIQNPNHVLEELSVFLSLSESFEIDKIFSNTRINGIMKNGINGKIGVSKVIPELRKEAISSWETQAPSKNLKEFLADKEALVLNNQLGYE